MRFRPLFFSCLVLVASACGEDAPAAPPAPPGSDASTPPSRVVGYARAEPYSKLILEVDAVAGLALRSGVDAHAITTLDAVLDKPGGITVDAGGTLASMGADHAWTDEELFALADASVESNLPGDTTSIHVMLVDGHSARDSDQGRVLGLAWNNQHLALFVETIDDACGSAGILEVFREELCRTTETSVLVHELGHVLGLVNVGAPLTSAHEDGAHPGHDVSSDCIMYWAAESEQIVDVLAPAIGAGESPQIGFDQACLDDLAAL